MTARVHVLALAALGLAGCSAALDFDFETREERVDAAFGTDLGAPDGQARDAGVQEGDAAGADATVPDQRIVVDGPPGSCEEGVDTDEDGVDDLDEGCLFTRDSDDDTVPDYLDADSDGDGIPDVIEVTVLQPLTEVIDSDEDGYADFLDLDSDGDGVLDEVEDADGDGRVGCCRKTCGEVVEGCEPVESAQCGAGQQCTGGPDGDCDPPLTLACAQGESDPRQVDSFGLGFDGRLGNAVCGETSALNPQGRRSVELYSSEAGDWTIALPEGLSGAYHELNIGGGQPRETAAVFHYARSRAGEDHLFGFTASVPSTAVSAKQEVDTFLGAGGQRAQRQRGGGQCASERRHRSFRRWLFDGAQRRRRSGAEVHLPGGGAADRAVDAVSWPGPAVGLARGCAADQRRRVCDAAGGRAAR